MNNGTSPLEQEQIKRLGEIGAQLRQLREDQMLTLEHIATKTMIQPRLLQAIEDGQLSKLPEPVYIQGFIKRYATALGVDGQAYAEAFPTKLDMQAVQPSWKDSPAAQLRPMHLYAAYLVLIMAAIGGLSYLLSRSVATTSQLPTPTVTVPSPRLSPTPLATPGSVQPTPATTAAIASPSPSPVADKPVRVSIQVTERSWMRVVVDGNTEFEEVMEAGTERSWSADRQITIRAGNAGGVMLTVNEGQPQPMGEPGRVKEVTFSAEGDQQAARLATPNAP
ncbi:MAG TPA: helix-turn-helix domain-containing protein [Synechococcales cyanobacterium M55_K2018_004]|nr:helix-turn-helix domain-containing protein [Synechococcales cyanobacterium M55_K2018_004]